MGVSNGSQILYKIERLYVAQFCIIATARAEKAKACNCSGLLMADGSASNSGTVCRRPRRSFPVSFLFLLSKAFSLHFYGPITPSPLEKVMIISQSAQKLVALTCCAGCRLILVMNSSVTFVTFLRSHVVPLFSCGTVQPFHFLLFNVGFFSSLRTIGSVAPGILGSWFPVML